MLGLLNGKVADFEKVSSLVTSAAWQVGFAHIAVGLAKWSNEPNGHSEMQQRLADEQFNILDLAPVNYACQTTMTCLDVCAAAAYRLRGSGTGGKPLRAGFESSISDLLTRTKDKNDPVVLLPNQSAWLGTVENDPRLNLLKAARNTLVHKMVQTHSVPPDSTDLIIDGKRWPNLQLSTDLADFAQSSFESFVEAVKADYP
ncbi:hypothetical protein V7968_16410 [Nocardia vulneris]|uniref:hypothetical protein n=1 Tax=Nocardia vulneris TaxID=1141657 RepID=UPI0030D196DB